MTAVGEKEGLDVRRAVADIVADVQKRGDEALVEYERTLDSAELTPQTLRVEAGKIAAARAAADPAFRKLIRRVATNIRAYQKRILHQPPRPLNRGGRQLGLRYTPVDRVGVYVPGGRALYPSTVLMTVVPAQVAGVRQIAIACPPRANGDVNPMVLALAGELGVKEVYRLGGAQAIAALAFGTPSVPAVDKIVGPGNAFVAEAKRQVFGRVGIDSIAGPSEVLIVADETADARWLAADLLAQAEHDPGSAILVTPSRTLAEAVRAAIEQQLPGLDRAEAIRRALERYSAIIVVPDVPAACEVANDFATEHLQIVTGDDEAALAMIRHAGAIFLGASTPVPLGDYHAGPSHVLPTGGTARFFGPLSCNDFLKASSVVRYDAAALAADAPDTIDFATREGLTAHANAIRIRTGGRRQ
jgi:histidinol dehydrogenase